MDNSKSTVRQRANEIKEYQCKNLIAVLENPMDIKNIGSVIRNANAFDVEKIYVVGSRKSLPDDWEELRERKQVTFKVNTNVQTEKPYKSMHTQKLALARATTEQ